MEPLLNLPRDQFLAALDELQLEPERTAFLVDQYNAANAPAEGAGSRGMMYNLLDNIIGYDDDIVTPGERLGAGVQGFASGLLSDPIGTGADIVRGGYETIEGAMAPGATPMDVLGAAGMAMGAGGIVTGPRGALRSGLLRDADSETPAQQVARLLREGRADDVTDDLMAQADPQEMYQLYVSGQTGMDLPMEARRAWTCRWTRQAGWRGRGKWGLILATHAIMATTWTLLRLLEVFSHQTIQQWQAPTIVECLTHLFIQCLCAKGQRVVCKLMRRLEIGMIYLQARLMMQMSPRNWTWVVPCLQEILKARLGLRDEVGFHLVK